MCLKPKKKVIVLGLDGFDPCHYGSPNGARRVAAFSESARTGWNGAVANYFASHETPVAWSTFATGTNPGGHGVFDFIRRDPNTYFPAQTFTQYEQKNIFLPPKAVNLRRGVPLWELLTKASVPSTIVRFPRTYPPDTIYGRMLAGMGVPDLRG